MTVAEQNLVRELATIIAQFAIRIERESVLARDEPMEALLARADQALWDTYMRLEPLN